jgi:2-iminobutanoate/2-iminopropanoate deaminase
MGPRGLCLHNEDDRNIRNVPQAHPDIDEEPGMKRKLEAATVGPFSAGIISDGICYLSAQGGLDPITGAVIPGGIRAETRQAMENIAAILASGGMTLDDVLTVTCYLTDINDWPAMNEEYASHFGADRILPARTSVAVAALPLNLRIEITATARAPR